MITTVVPNMQSGTLFNVQVEARDASNTIDVSFSGSISLSAAAVGGSNFTSGNTVAAAAGVASFTVFLNNAADNYQITASATGVTNGLSNTFNVTATHLALLSIANVRSGDPFNVTVQARDANNNLAENFTGSVNLNAAATGGSNFVGGTANVAAVSGAASFVSLVLNNAADNYVVTAASAGLTSGVSNGFNVGARHLTITTVVANMQAGTPFSLNVEGRDANNAVAENFSGSVNLSAAATGGSNFNGGTQSVAATAGSATFNNLALNNAADNYGITVSSVGVINGLSNTFNVTATHLAVVSVPDVRSGDAFNVIVQARDANNALAENFTGNISLNAAATGGSNFVGGTKNVAAVAGMASFSGLLLNNAADAYIITAASAGLTAGVSNAFNVTALHLTITTVVASMAAGTPFGLSVEARDANNAIAENFNGSVNLDAAAVGGSNFNGGTHSVAAVAGSASFVGLVLSDAADGYVITASAPGPESGLSNSFNVTAEGPHLVITTVVANMQSGTLFNVTVEARDASGTVDSSFNGSVNLDAAATGGSNLNGGTQSVAAVAGSATFNNLALSNAADNYAVIATATGLNNGVSNAFNVTATHLAVLSVTNVRSGDPFNVTVEARDANNNVAENFTGNVNINAAATGGSNFVGGTVNVAAATGTASFVGLVLNNAADGYTITAASPGLTSGVSNSFNVTARHLVINSVVANMQAGTPFSLSVEGRDANNAVAENFNSTVSLNAAAIGGSNFNGGTQSVAAVAGSATLSVLALNNAADNYLLTASSAGVINGISNSFNVTATHLAVLAIANVRSGDAFNVTVQLRDANNNVAENFTGNIGLNAAATGGSNFNGGTANVAAVAGAASFVGLVLNNAADNYVVTAASAGLTSGVSNSFNVTARHLVITTVVANMQAGTPFSLSVEARDGNNAVAENFNGSLDLNAAAIGGSNFNGGTAATTAVAGSATFNNLALNDAANNYQITASATGVINGLSNAFNVTATHLAVLAVANVRAGDSFNVTAQARDANNNVAENFTGNISLDASATGGSNFVGGTANVAAAAGTASFVGLVLNDAADGYTISAASPGLTDGVSNSFNVTARTLVITTVVANMQAGTAFSLSVEARDANNVVAENFTSTVGLDADAVGGSNFNGGTQSIAATAGTATFSVLVLNDAADNYQITASSAGLINGLSNTFNVTANHLSVLAIANVRSGDAFNVTVQARDANNNVAENFTGNIDLNAAATGGSNFVGGTANVAAVAGGASFVGLVLSDAANGYVATATSTSLTNGVSNSFNVTARTLVVTTVMPPEIDEETPFSVTVEARDANNIVAENFTSIVSLDAAAPGGSNFVGGTRTAAAGAGTATFTALVLDVPANGYVLTATAAGLNAGISNTFNVIPLTAEDRIDRLIAYITSLGLENPVERVLINTLQKAIDDLAQARPHNACVRFATFEVQVGEFRSAGKISALQSAELLARIDQIQLIVGCAP